MKYLLLIQIGIFSPNLCAVFDPLWTIHFGHDGGTVKGSHQGFYGVSLLGIKGKKIKYWCTGECNFKFFIYGVINSAQNAGTIGYFNCM